MERKNKGLRARACLKFCLAAALGCMGLAGRASGATITAYYGDDDGFGLGVTSGTLSPFTVVASGGEAPLTDTLLIGNGFAGQPAFAPTGGFSFAIPVGDTITAATLTLRTDSFDSANPLDGPNVIMLDGLAVPSSFINGFSNADTDNVETRTVSLNPAFFALLADGSVSLTGTHISETVGARSFAVDFLRLDITTTPAVVSGSGVPLPLAALAAPFGLLASAVAGKRVRRGGASR